MKRWRSRAMGCVVQATHQDADRAAVRPLSRDAVLGAACLHPQFDGWQTLSTPIKQTDDKQTFDLTA